MDRSLVSQYFSSPSQANYPDKSTYGFCTGGASSSDVTISGVNYRILTFTSTATLTVAKGGFIDFVLVGGGGGGGYGSNTGVWSYGNQGGSGGGGGEILFATSYVIDGTYTITIGAGGGNYGPGAPTRVGGVVGLIAMGGAPGLPSPGPNSFWGGGAPGGHGFFQTAGRGYSGASFSGNNGGGGGGMGGAASGTTAGAGFDVSIWIGGSTTTLAAGGAGGTSGGAGASGSANTGNGGAGGGYNSGNPSGGSGGSGVAYVRFKI